MKRLLLLLAVACVSLASCSDTLDLNNPNDIKKKFDFSEVDTSNLQEIHIEDGFDLPELTVISGTLDDCLWVGLFDTQSGSLKYQYTDVDHPISYFEYGEEHKYGWKIEDIYIENNQVMFVIQYSYTPDNGFIIGAKMSRWDFIVVDRDTQYRYIFCEKLNDYYFASIKKWANSSIRAIVGGWRNGGEGIIYDFDTKMILSRAIGGGGGNFIISLSNVLHFWDIDFDDDTLDGVIRLKITEYQCTYDTRESTNKYIEIFSRYTGNLSEKPRYSYEYKIRTNDHISAVVTQTKYDGTVTTKTVDVRLENDEIIVEME